MKIAKKKDRCGFPRVERTTMKVTDLLAAMSKYNPRKMPPAHRDALRASLCEYGMVQEIVFNRRTGTVVGGHQKILIANEESEGDAPVTVVDLPIEKERALNVALNSPTLAGEFTDDLQPLLAQLEADLPDLFAALNLDDLIEEKSHRVNHFAPLREMKSLKDDRAAAYAWVKMAVVEYSGGRDSTAALLWARVNLPGARLVALHADMGADFPGFPAHVYSVTKTIDCELALVRTENIIIGFMQKGWPIWVGPWCQTRMNHSLDQWVKSNCIREETLILRGTRSKQKKATSDLQPNVELKSMPRWKRLEPIFDWTEESVHRLVESAGVPIWDGYALGMQRTACWCCPGQRPIAYAALRREYPCLFRAYEMLEKFLGTGGFWTPSLQGFSIAQAADRGDQMLAAAQIAQSKKAKTGGRKQATRHS